jgi:hypothetical protein
MPPSTHNPWQHGPLRVTSDGRGFEHADGTPFFLMGDTAWEMIHFATEAEVDSYFTQRVAQGFNTTLTVAVAELEGFTKPNHAGHTPFEGSDLSQTNEAYWQHVDAVFSIAERHGCYVGLLPAWGTWVDQGHIHIENAHDYGAWIATRYKDRTNLIWIIGGDLDYKGYHGQHDAVFQALAMGIRSVDTQHLIGYHAKTRSSLFAHNESWLDFNMFQTSHQLPDNPDSYRWIEADRALSPAKPTLDGEPRYEDHPIAWDEKNGSFNDFDARQAAYWSVFSGAAGHVYGHIGVIAWKHDRLSPLPWYLPPSIINWDAAITRPGAFDMAHLMELRQAISNHPLTPDQSIITSENPEDGGHIRAARTATEILIYSPYGRPFDVDLGFFTNSAVTCTWFDPRTGKTQKIERHPSNSNTFTPPGQPERGNDWVLIVATASAHTSTF